MKHIFVIVGFFLIVLGASQCEQPEPVQKQMTGAEDIFYNQERDTVVRSAALRVVPGRDWTMDTKDSLSLYDAVLLNQDYGNSRETIFRVSTLRDFFNTDKALYVDSLAQVYTDTLDLNVFVGLKSNGAIYKVQSDSTATVDSITVVPTGSRYAVLQPVNGEYDLKWFGATDDNTTDNVNVFSRITAFDSLSDVVIKGDTFFTTDATINNRLIFKGGKIRNTGTLNIRSIEDPGLKQVFTLSGAQKFTNRPEYVRPEWWGGFADSTAEVDDPFEAAFESIHDIGGGTIQLDSGIYFMPVEGATISGMDIVIQGIKNKSKIVTEQGDGTARYALIDVATGSNYYNSITIKDVTFERGSGGNNYAMNIRGNRYKELNLIGCTFRHNGLLIDQIEKGLIEDCYFYTEGDFNHNGMVITGGCRGITIHRNVFRYLEDAITISGTPDQANTNITITDNYFDMGWMTGASEYTGSATYPGGGVIKDLTASFPALVAGTTIRLLDTLSTGTGSYPENNLVEDGAATFITDGVEPYDLVKVGDKYGLVDQVLGETRLQLEFWMDSITRLPDDPPAGAAYVVYQLNYGEVASNTDTTITVAPLLE